MPSIPMYLAGLIVTFAGLYAAHMSLGDPSFATLVSGLTLIGFAASYIVRQQNIAPRNVELPAFLVCVCVVLMAMMTDPSDSFLAPASVAEDRSKALALLLTWLTVFRSFTLTSDAALLFCCVPTIALLGLVGTSTTDPLLATIFLVFIGAAIFMMVHENVRQTSLSRRERLGRAPKRSAATWAGQLQATMVCTVLAVVIANVSTPYVQDVGAFVRINSGLQNLRVASDTTAAPPTSNAPQQTEILVGAGPVSLTNEIVFTVYAKEPQLWRGSTYDHYTGDKWQNLFGNLATPLRQIDIGPADPRFPDQATYQIEPNQFTMTASRAHSLKQHIRFVAGAPYEIYGAGDLRRVRISHRTMLLEESGSVRMKEPLTNAEYDVESAVQELTDEDRNAPPSSESSYTVDMRQHYLQLPATSSAAIDKIRRQAQQITADKRSTCEKVEALKFWIGTQCKYDTSTPKFPDKRDVVEYFLFDGKRGYCDSFATSLAVMCRTIGIPARVASGYQTGELERGLWVVREKNKHLWTEVYIPNAGWQSFDATEGAEDISPAATTTKTETVGFWARLFKNGWWPPVVLALGLILLCYVLKLEVFDRFMKPRRLAVELHLPESNYAIVTEYEKVCELLSKRGIGRHVSETPLEYRTRASNALDFHPAARDPLAEITGLVTKYRYCAATADEAAVSSARACSAAVVEALRGAPKRFAAVPAPESASA
jgi:transglutaminase-like putative cysteine protease